MQSVAELKARVVVEGVPEGNKKLMQFEGYLKRVSGYDATATLGADVDHSGFTVYNAEMTAAEGKSASASLGADVDHAGFQDFAARVDSANLRTRRPITQTVMAEVDDGSFTATMAKVRALKSKVDRESGGGGLTHSAAGIVVPFGALPTAAAVASPELLALAGAATAVAGSAGEAALGVGALVGGAYGAGAVGIAGIAAVAVPAIASLKAVSKAQTAYTLAVRQYGKESTQAETAAKKLRIAEAQAGPEAVKLAGALRHVKSEWSTLSAPGRNEFLGALADGIDHLEGKLPMLAKSANRSTTAMRHDFDSFLGQTTGKGSGFDHFIGSMTDLFVHEGPMITHTLGDWAKIFENIAEAAGPSLEMVTGQLEHWSNGIEKSTEDAPKLRGEISGLVDQTESWVHFLGQGTDLITTIFGAGAGEGQSLVEDATAKVEDWRTAIEGDPSGTESFFAESGEEAKELTTILAGLIGTWYQEAKAIQPIADEALHIVDALNSLKIGNVSALTVLLGTGFAVGSAAKLIKTLEILKGYAGIKAMIAGEETEQSALIRVQEEGMASNERLITSNEALAASYQGVAAAQGEVSAAQGEMAAGGQLSMLETGGVGVPEQAGQMSMFPMGGGVLPQAAEGVAPAAEEAAGGASAGLLAKGMKLALPAAIGAIGIGNIVTSATHGDWQDAGFEAGGSLAGGIAGFFVGGPAGAMIGAGVGSVLGEVVSNLFGGSELGALQQQIIATSRHAAATFQAQKESSEALAAAQGQLRGAQSRAGEATDDLTAAERRLHRLREGDAATTAQVLGAEGKVASARHQRAQSVREETQAYENVRLTEGANRHSLVEGVAAANLAIAADQRHVDKLNERWQTESHGKQLTEEVTHATGKLATEEQHRADLLAKAERASAGFRNELEGLTLAESEYGTHGHVLTSQLSEVHAKIHALEVQAHANPLKPMAGELAHLRGEAGKLETKLIGFLQHSGPHLREWALSGVHSTQRLSGGFEALEGSVAQALEGIQSNTAGVLQSFGAAKIPNYEIKSMLHAFGKAKGGPGIGSVPELATGGIVPGVASGDVHFTHVRPNSFILNKKATAAYGFNEGGMVPVALEPGERRFSPEEVGQIGLGNLMAMNASVPRFAEGGLAAEPQITGSGGALHELGQHAIHRAYVAAQRDITAHTPKPKTTAGGDVGGYSGPPANMQQLGDNAYVDSHTLAVTSLLDKKFGLTMSSGFRSVAHNAEIGGAPGSLHTHGSPSNPGATDSVGSESAMGAYIAYVKQHVAGIREAFVDNYAGLGDNAHVGFFAGGGLVGGNVQAFAGGGQAGKKAVQITHPGWEPRFDKQAAHAWGRARQLFGTSDPMPDAFIASGLLGQLGDAGVAFKGPHAIELAPGTAQGVMRGGDYGRETLLHEWAHLFQGDLPAKWEREGGATLFSKWAGPKVFGDGFDFQWPHGYRPYAQRVLKEKGMPWVERGQFGLQKLAAGGLVGGGAPMKLAAGGFTGSGYTVKGAPASASQMHVAGEIGKANDATHAPYEAQVAIFMAATQENDMTGTNTFEVTSASGSGNRNDSTYEQALRWQTEGYYDGPKLGAGGGIAKSKKSSDPGLVAQEVEGSAYPTLYEQWKGEGQKWAGGWSGKANETKAEETAHTFKETPKAMYLGCHTGALSLGSGAPGSLDAVDREIHRREAELERYSAAASAADHARLPATAHALRKNVATLEKRIRELRRARVSLRRKVARKAAEKRVTAKLGRQYEDLTGLEPGIEKAQRTYNEAEQLAGQIVDLEPTQPEPPPAPEIAETATEAERTVAEKNYESLTHGIEKDYVNRLTAYIEGQEGPAYERVLGAEADWRNLILGAEHTAAGDWSKGKVGGLEGGWEYQVENLVEQETALTHHEEAIERFAKKVEQEIATFHHNHQGEELTDRLKARQAKREELVAKLPGMRAQGAQMAFSEKETRKTLGEGRGLFYPGGARIKEPKPPIPGSGSFESDLEEVQGIHWPDQHEYLKGLPHNRQAGSFGGAIWTTQEAIEGLGLSVTAAQNGLAGAGAGGGGTTTQQSELTALEKEELLHFRQREAVGNALGPVLSQFEHSYPLPYMGAYADGGVALVGERGPELAHFPSGTRVHSAPDTQAMLGRGDLKVVVNGHINQAPGDTRDPVEVLEKHPRAAAWVNRVRDSKQRPVVNAGATRAWR